MSNLQDLGISAAFEAAVVEHCVAAVKAGAVMNEDLVQEAMHAVIRRQYALLDNPAALRAVADEVYDNIRAKNGAAAKRTIDAAAVEACAGVIAASGKTAAEFFGCSIVPASKRLPGE